MFICTNLCPSVQLCPYICVHLCPVQVKPFRDEDLNTHLIRINLDDDTPQEVGGFGQNLGAPIPLLLVLPRQLIMEAVPNGYPNPTRYPVFSSIPDPTRFNFENHRVAGNPKYRVLPEISGNTRSFGYYPKFRVLPDISGCKLFVNYPEYPELPGNTRNYPRVKEIPENTRSYISTLLPDPNPTRYPVFCPIPDPTTY